MRVFRALIATLAALLLSGSLLTAPAHADDRPKREIQWETTQTSWRAFKLKATITDMVEGKAVIQLKKCGKCGWKKFKKVDVNSRGVVKTKIFAPTKKGKWLYRVQVNAQDGYARSRSSKIGVLLKNR
jgi:hypothetical protein